MFIQELYCTLSWDVIYFVSKIKDTLGSIGNQTDGSNPAFIAKIACLLLARNDTCLAGVDN